MKAMTLIRRITLARRAKRGSFGWVAAFPGHLGRTRGRWPGRAFVDKRVAHMIARLNTADGCPTIVARVRVWA